MMVLATMTGVSGAVDACQNSWPEARPVKNLLQRHVARPQRDKAQGDAGDSGGQRRPQNIPPFNGWSESLLPWPCPRIFTGVNEEEGALAENRRKDGAHEPPRSRAKSGVCSALRKYSNLLGGGGTSASAPNGSQPSNAAKMRSGRLRKTTPAPTRWGPGLRRGGPASCRRRTTKPVQSTSAVTNTRMLADACSSSVGPSRSSKMCCTCREPLSLVICSA